MNKTNDQYSQELKAIGLKLTVSNCGHNWIIVKSCGKIISDDKINSISRICEDALALYGIRRPQVNVLQLINDALN